MSSPQDEGKKRYLDENEGVIDTSPLDIPPPIPNSHPLARNLSIKQILLSMQNDIMTLEKAEYNKLVTDSKARTNPKTTIPPLEERKEEEKPAAKYSAQLVEDAKKKTDLGQIKVRSPQRSKTKVLDNNVAILGTYVKNPKIPSKELVEGGLSGNSQKIPAIKVRDKPTKRIEKELLMFKEIFVHPKETKLEELQKKDRQELQQDTNVLQRAKKLQENEAEIEAKEERYASVVDANDSKKLMGSLRISPSKIKKVVADDKELKDMLEEPEVLICMEKDDRTDAVDEVIDIVMRMFNSRLKSRAGESFFSQQIQVQPPEGLNATVAAPLTPGGGWAPSIPSLVSSINKTSFKVKE